MSVGAFVVTRNEKMSHARGPCALLLTRVR